MRSPVDIQSHKEIFHPNSDELRIAELNRQLDMKWGSIKNTRNAIFMLRIDIRNSNNNDEAYVPILYI